MIGSVANAANETIEDEQAGWPSPNVGMQTQRGSVGKVHSGEFCDALNVGRIRVSSNSELCDLQVRPMGGEHGHLLLRHGLHDVVNVDPLTTRMRPETVVDLIGFDESGCDV